MAHDRHQRHEPRSPGHEQQRTAVLDVPHEVPADRAAQLQRITATELVGQIRRDLAVLEPFDRQRERCVLRRRGDRVRALRLVAILGGETDVDVLAGDVPGPAGTWSTSVFARGVSTITSLTAASRHSIRAGATLSPPDSAALSRGRRSCGSRRPPRSRARRPRAARGRGPTSRSSRSTDAGPAAAPGRRARARAARRRTRRRSTPGRRSGPRAAGWSCSRRQHHAVTYPASVSTSSSSVSTDTPVQVVSSLDHLVTQWMSTVTVSARKRDELLPRPRHRLLDGATDRQAPLIQRRAWRRPGGHTGKSRVTYWPGGTRAGSTSTRRPRKPRENGGIG